MNVTHRAIRWGSSKQMQRTSPWGAIEIMQGLGGQEACTHRGVAAQGIGPSMSVKKFTTGGHCLAWEINNIYRVRRSFVQEGSCVRSAEVGWRSGVWATSEAPQDRKKLHGDARATWERRPRSMKETRHFEKCFAWDFRAGEEWRGLLEGMSYNGLTACTKQESWV